MFDKLKAIKIQYEQLLARMQQPETYQDAALFARCDRESRELLDLFIHLREILKVYLADASYTYKGDLHFFHKYVPQ